MTRILFRKSFKQLSLIFLLFLVFPSILCVEALEGFDVKWIAEFETSEKFDILWYPLDYKLKSTGSYPWQRESPFGHYYKDFSTYDGEFFVALFYLTDQGYPWHGTMKVGIDYYDKHGNAYWTKTTDELVTDVNASIYGFPGHPTLVVTKSQDVILFMSWKYLIPKWNESYCYWESHYYDLRILYWWNKEGQTIYKHHWKIYVGTYEYSEYWEKRRNVGIPQKVNGVIKIDDKVYQLKEGEIRTIIGWTDSYISEYGNALYKHWSNGFSICDLDRGFIWNKEYPLGIIQRLLFTENQVYVLVEKGNQTVLDIYSLTGQLEKSIETYLFAPVQEALLLGATKLLYSSEYGSYYIYDISNNKTYDCSISPLSYFIGDEEKLITVAVSEYGFMANTYTGLILTHTMIQPIFHLNWSHEFNYKVSKSLEVYGALWRGKYGETPKFFNLSVSVEADNRVIYEKEGLSVPVKEISFENRVEKDRIEFKAEDYVPMEVLHKAQRIFLEVSWDGDEFHLPVSQLMESYRSQTEESLKGPSFSVWILIIILGIIVLGIVIAIRRISKGSSTRY